MSKLPDCYGNKKCRDTECVFWEECQETYELYQEEPITEYDDPNQPDLLFLGFKKEEGV